MTDKIVVKEAGRSLRFTLDAQTVLYRRVSGNALMERNSVTSWQMGGNKMRRVQTIFGGACWQLASSPPIRLKRLHLS